MKNIYGFTLEELENYFVEIELRSFMVNSCFLGYMRRELKV